jgi:protein-tyrosine-phosphatase
MAAGFLRALGGDAVEVRSARSMPADRINPVAVEAMAEVGIDLAAQHPKILTAEDWELDDPAGQGLEHVRPIRDAIRGHVVELLASLDLA